MFKSTDLTNSESISLVQEITKIGIEDTPLTSLLMARGLIGTANGTIQTWRERTYDTTEDISVIEGNDKPIFYQSGRGEFNNILQIFEKGVSISGTANAINVTGQGKLLSSEVEDRLLEVKVAIEKAITKGVRNDASTAPFIRKMDGIENWADPANQVVGATIGKITEPEIKATVKTLWDQGLPTGTYFALVNADLKEKIDALYDSKYSYIADHDVFGLKVSGIKTNYGTIYFLLSRHASTDKMTVFDVNQLAIDFLRKPAFEPFAKSGDSVSGHVIAEATLRVGSKKAVAQYSIKA